MSQSIETLVLLQDLVSFPTVSRASNRPLIDFVASHLSALGIRSTQILTEDGTKANLFATIGPPEAPGVLLSGHTDVVPVDGQAWTTDPFALRVDRDRAIGRGAVDMKGFLACMLRIALRAATRDLKAPLHLAFSHDEEVGCVGVRRMLPSLASLPCAPALCIIGEPTSMELVLGHKGKSMGRIRCRGLPGHSSDPDGGANAIMMAADVLQAVGRLQNDLRRSASADPAFTVPHTTLHVGRIDGGTMLNVIPSSCTMEFEIRHVSGDNPARIVDALRLAAARVADDYSRGRSDVGVDVLVDNAYPALSCPADDPSVLRVRGLLGAEGQSRSVSYGTEAGLFAAHLCVSSVVCGPGSVAQAHKPDEFIELSQLAACDAFLDRLLDGMAMEECVRSSR